MWKHKNFINLQLCAGEQDELAGTWVFNDTIDTSQFFSTPDGSMYYGYEQDPTPRFSILVNFNSNNMEFLGIGFSDAGIVTVRAHDAYYGRDNPFMGTSKGWSSDAYKTITITSKLSEVTNGEAFLTWLQANGTKQSTPQPTLTFKHFFDAGTIGSGTVKFRHYSQQEPSSGETWVLNETLNSTKLAKTAVDFVSNNVQYKYIERSGTFSSPDLFYYTSNDYVQVYSVESPNFPPSYWIDQAYRTLTFSAPPTGDLLTWLQANGTKQGGGK